MQRLLLSHLAQFSAFSKQGEVLCTRGLEYLLENRDARGALTAYIAAQTGRTVSPDLMWHPEVVQEDKGRPDLETCTADGKPLVKIEAKLGAELSEGQLLSFIHDLQKRADGGLLLVLVPGRREKEASSLVANMKKSAAFPTDCVVKVVLWDEILEKLGAVTSEPFSGDLAQFRAMYRALNGDNIEPITSVEELLEWREREEVFINVVDRVTRLLVPEGRILPFGTDNKQEPIYQRRYVCRRDGGKESCYSIGVRDPFQGHESPVWLRFNSTTGMFAEIRDRLRSSRLAEKLVFSDDHVWIPLEYPRDAEGGQVVDSLLGQAREIADIAYQEA